MQQEFDQVVLVDEFDNPLGVKNKQLAHEQGGFLHRAFSILIFNTDDELLLQRRARSKYHCAGLWSNSCCSHPREGRSVISEARLRLEIELGFSTELEPFGTCIYKEKLGNEMTEWELDHIFVGRYSGDILPNPIEVESICWIGLNELERDIASSPEKYTPWFPHVLTQFSIWQDTAVDRTDKGAEISQQVPLD